MSFFVYIVFFLVGRTLFYVLILGLILFSFFLPSDSVINPTSLNHLIKVFFFLCIQHSRGFQIDPHGKFMYRNNMFL